MSFKLNKRNLKSKDAIVQRIEKILDKYKAKRFYQITLKESEIKYKVQAGKGRPGPNTQYKIVIEKLL